MSSKPDDVTEEREAFVLNLLQNDYKLAVQPHHKKTVHITEDHGDLEDLTYYRLQLIAQFAVNVYSQAGFTVIRDDGVTTILPSQHLHWHLSLSSRKQVRLLLASSSNGSTEMLQQHPSKVVCGVVINKNTQKRERLVATSGYFSLRGKDLKKGCDQKTVLPSVVTLDLLCMKNHQCVCLNFISPAESMERAGLLNRGSIFCLYNYARLAKLFQKHSCLVAEGYYSSLSPVDGTVVRHLLNSKPEMELLTVCLQGFVSTKNELENCLIAGKFPEPYKLCRFLDQMCRQLSRYYHSNHVLTGNQSHLLPMMTARLHLLQAIHRVMDQCFFLLNIAPPHSM